MEDNAALFNFDPDDFVVGKIKLLITISMIFKYLIHNRFWTFC
jgi:hypothetical protein